MYDDKIVPPIVSVTDNYIYYLQNRMEKKTNLFELIPHQGILPLYYHHDTEVSLGVLRSLYEADIRAVEYTNRGEPALTNFQAMRKVCDQEMKDMYLGIGTIKDGDMAQAFIEAGADFIISPGLVESVAEVSERHQILWIPGCMTPSEIIRAESMGARLIKLFPGNVLGPGFMSAIKELFPDLLFMPTGGVDMNQENISAWFKAGVCAVGMGSKLITKELMQAKDYQRITESTKQVLSIIRTAKS
jgi:2-dehydro-3-deoxyphosphogluconate aldolase/(4S)-4-hydroxy-2-oxoglutarate aldolase